MRLLAFLFATGLTCLQPGAGHAQPATERDRPEGGASLAAPAPRAAATTPPSPAPAVPEEDGARLAVPPAGDVPPSPEPPADSSAADRPPSPPRVELAYARYRFADGYGGGGVHALQFGGYLPTGALRLGGYGEMGMRDYSLADSTDAIVRATAVAGYQHLAGLGGLRPFAAVVGTGGVLFGKRFSTPLSHTMWGAGLEIGADVLLVERLWAGASFTWIRLTMDGLRYDLLMIRLRVGL
jgi:hypothetical protein